MAMTMTMTITITIPFTVTIQTMVQDFSMLKDIIKIIVLLMKVCIELSRDIIFVFVLCWIAKEGIKSQQH